jgi:hypothetical protein
MKMGRILIWGAVLVLVVVVLFLTTRGIDYFPTPTGHDVGGTSKPALLLGKDAKASGDYEIPLHPMEELDFKTRQEIFELRKQRVLEHGKLIASYEPSHAVFGLIEDNKPWWGIYGIYGHGPGERSIEGPLEQSRFLLNPYLLVGLSEQNAFITSASTDGTSASFPEPLRIVWRPESALVRVEYQVSDHFRYIKNNDFHPDEQRKFTLIAYNARDLGFRYLFVDPEKSRGVTWTNGTRDVPAVIRQYIHCGGSCGQSGGCNSMSPDQPELVIDVADTPARAYIKLWRNQPQNASDPSDMTEIIEMQ